MSWYKYFLTLSVVVASKSKDPSTKCGCVIANKKNEILSTGFNGPMRNADDSKIPMTRPEKYQWMIHAEHNAILCSKKDLTSCIAYVSGRPCPICLQLLYHVGIREVYYTDWSKPKICEDQKKLYSIFYSAIKEPFICGYYTWSEVNDS